MVLRAARCYFFRLILCCVGMASALPTAKYNTMGPVCRCCLSVLYRVLRQLAAVASICFLLMAGSIRIWVSTSELMAGSFRIWVSALDGLLMAGSIRIWVSKDGLMAGSMRIWVSGCGLADGWIMDLGRLALSIEALTGSPGLQSLGSG